MNIGRQPIVEFFHLRSGNERSRVPTAWRERVGLVLGGVVAAIEAGNCACAACGADLVVETDMAVCSVGLTGDLMIAFPFCVRCGTSDEIVMALAQREFQHAYHHWGHALPEPISGPTDRVLIGKRLPNGHGALITIERAR